jgi:hypothetical protein
MGHLTDFDSRGIMTVPKILSKAFVISCQNELDTTATIKKSSEKGKISRVMNATKCSKATDSM